jgi:YaiO family outer membrane protein
MRVEHRIKGVMTAFLFILSLQIVAQEKPTADGLYAAARKFAFDDKDYAQAISYCNQALALTPSYTEITLFKARLYAWDNKKDSARIYFDKALQEKPEMEEAYVALSDFEYWNHNDSLVIPIIDRGLQYHPQSVPLLLRKAKALDRTREYHDAIILTDSVLKLERNNTEARALSQKLRDNISKNSIGIKYDYVRFDKQFPDPWHIASLNYTRQTSIGPVSIIANYANRFKTEGLQIEAEAYPRISKTFYTYVNLGYSADVGIFPKWRAGASVYMNLPAAFEAEAGIRYLYFTDNKYIYTLYAGKYLGSFLLGARTYLTPSSATISQSYNVLARYYYRSADEYVGINAGYGISPDERAIAYLLNSNYKLISYRAGLDLRYAIRKLNIITFNASIINQEYLAAIWGNQFQIGAGYIRRF